MAKLSDLYKKRDLTQVQEKVLEAKKGKFQKDARFWEMTVDKENKGSAVIRFLPNIDGEIPNDDVVLKYDRYYIETPKGLYTRPAPENIGRKSFASEVVNDLWAKYKETGDEQYKELFKKRIKKSSFVTNILVLDDEGNPDNNGKVFLFKFGLEIYEIMMKRMGFNLDKKNNLVLRDEKELEREIKMTGVGAIDIFSPFDGANFMLVANNNGNAKFRTYKESAFERPSQMYQNEDDIVAVLEQRHSILDLISDEHYQSYDDEKTDYIAMTGDYYELFPEKARAHEAADMTREQTSAGGSYNRQSTSSDDYGVLNTSKKVERFDDEEEMVLSKPTTTASSNSFDDADLEDEYEALLNG